MPFLLPAAATAIAATATTAAATAATATATAAATASLTTIATNALINLAISAAMSALTPQVGQAGRPVDWILDPDAPIPFAAGRVGVAGSIVHKATFGPDLMYYGLVSVLSGAGPIKSVQGFKADEEAVTFNGIGMAVSSQWANEMWFKPQLGLQPTTTAITSPTNLKNSTTLPGWGSSQKMNGKAAYMLVMGENSKRTAYPNGEIKPLVVIQGLYGWDPRLDSTYPGGSGACRLNNPATWVYIDNPILWGLKWALGLWEGPTGKGAPQVDYQVGGIGAKVEGIDVASFVAGANVADANGWKVAAYPTTDDDKAQVLDSFLQAGGCIYAQKAGKISCIQRAAPRTSIVTISAEDTAGPLEIDTAASRINRINTLRPRFWSEANRWQMTAIEEVTATAYQTEDGGKRTRPIDFPFVPSATQAAQLAALQIANTREGIAGVIPLKPHLQRITPGDAFTITEAGFVLNGLKCLCLNTDYDPATGIHRVTFVSETDAKYPFALGQSPTAPTSPTLTVVDPTFVSPPAAGDWTVVPRPPAPGGGQLPAFDLTGIVSNATATAILVEYGPSATGPWKQAYQGPPTVTTVPIEGLQPGETYYVAVSYQRDNNYSERQVYGPYTAPLLVADTISDTGPIFDTLTEMVNEALADFDPSGAIGDQLVALQDEIDALDADINGLQTLTSTHTTQIAGKVETSTFNAQVTRIDDVETINASLQAAVVDLEGNKAEATDVSLLQARAGATEAEVIDLEIAQAAETTARSQAISQVTARLANVPNMLPNSTAAVNLSGWNAGSWTRGEYAPIGPFFFCNTVGDNFALSPLIPAQTGLGYTVSFNADTGSGVGAVYVAAYSADGTVLVQDGLGFLAFTSNDWLVRRVCPTFILPAGATAYRIVLQKSASAPYVAINQIMANLGAARDWRDDASQRVIGAAVTSLSGAVGDLQTGKANAVDVTTLYAEVDGVSADLEIAAAVAAAADGKASSVFGVTQDVNGLITGFGSFNDGDTSGFAILTDAFSLQKPGGGARTEFSGGNWRVYDASGVLRTRMGVW